jgi:hypothetical protein
MEYTDGTKCSSKQITKYKRKSRDRRICARVSHIYFFVNMGARYSNIFAQKLTVVLWFGSETSPKD